MVGWRMNLVVAALDSLKALGHGALQLTDAQPAVCSLPVRLLHVTLQLHVRLLETVALVQQLAQLHMHQLPVPPPLIAPQQVGHQLHKKRKKKQKKKKEVKFFPFELLR